MLKYMYDEDEFMSDFGIRSLSKHHLDSPYIFNFQDMEHRVDYLPGKQYARL